MVGQSPTTTFSDNAGCPFQTQASLLVYNLRRFSAHWLPVFLGVDGLEHQAHFPGLAPRRSCCTFR